MEDIKTIMAASTPSEGWVALLRSGELQKVFPELYALTHTCKGGHKNIFWHTMQVLDNVAKVSESRSLRWAALLHDIGKMATRSHDREGRCTFNGHEAEGAKMVKAIFVRFGLDDAEREDVERLVAMHMIPGEIIRDGMSDRAINRLRGKAGRLLPSLLILSEADVTTDDERRRERIHKGLNSLRQRIEELIWMEERPELSQDEFEAIFDEDAEVVTSDKPCLRENYGGLKRVTVKSKGAGKGTLYDWNWEWSDYKSYVAAKRAAAPKDYALLRLYYMRKFASDGVKDVKEYRNTVKAIRMRYGLSKSVVAPFMSLA